MNRSFTVVSGSLETLHHSQHTPLDISGWSVCPVVIVERVLPPPGYRSRLEMSETRQSATSDGPPSPRAVVKTANLDSRPLNFPAEEP